MLHLTRNQLSYQLLGNELTIWRLKNSLEFTHFCLKL